MLRISYDRKAMEFDADAERLLRLALDAAKSASNKDGGRYAYFPDRGRIGLSEKRLIEYCSEWFPGRPGRQFATQGYRPGLHSVEDRSLIGLHSSGLYVQGRVDSVVCLSVIAACCSLGISSHTGKALPSSTAFWDAIDSFGVSNLVSESRPGTASRAFIAIDRSKSKIEPQKREFEFKLPFQWPDDSEQLYQKALREVTIQSFPKFRIVSCIAEADDLIKSKMRSMESSRTNSYVCVELSHPLKLLVGEFIWFFTCLWPDSALSNCGTRWRPRTTTGAVQLISSESVTGGSRGISASGKQFLIDAFMPLMAACSLFLDPRIAAKTDSFRVFWNTMSCDPPRFPDKFNHSNETIIDYLYRSSNWVSEKDTALWRRESFQEIDNVLKKQLYINLSIFQSSNGFWSGSNSLPFVKLSTNTFSDWVCAWTPDACIELIGSLRARPGFLPKGGISMDESGTYFSIQSSNEASLSMLIMLAAFVVGVPPEYAALSPYANPFWYFVASIHSDDYVRDRRSDLQQRLVSEPPNKRDIEARLLAFKLSSFRCLVLPSSELHPMELEKLGRGCTLSRTSINEEPTVILTFPSSDPKTYEKIQNAIKPALYFSGHFCTVQKTTVNAAKG